VSLQIALQAAQLLALLGGFAATIAVQRNDTKWVIKSLEEHKVEDRERFSRIEDRLDAFK
jgi:hypothetical protein